MSELDPSRPAATVKAYFDAVNARDYDRLRALFADDASFHPVGSADRHGADEIAAYYPPLLAGFDHGTDTPTRISVAGDVVTVEIHFAGRTVQGADLEFDAVDVFDIDADGRIARLSLWYDTLDVARQVRAGRDR